MTPLPPPDKLAAPPTIRLGRLAIAAGLAGYSLSLVYHGFATPLLAEVWKLHAQEVGEKEAIFIANHRDLRQLASPAPDGGGAAKSSPKTLRLAFIRDIRLFDEMAWATELGSFGVAGKSALPPAVFAIAGVEDDGDAPGARLDLSASPAAEQMILSWLQQVKKDENVSPTIPRAAVVVDFPKAIDKLCWPTPQGSDAAGIFRLRDCQVFRALLAGACVLRYLDCGTPPTAVTILTVSAEDYKTVHTLLTSDLVRSADEPVYPKAAAMVARANEYKKMLHGTSETPKVARLNEATESVCPSRPITRRELEDLGKPHSRANEELVAYLLKQEKGFSRFRSIGLVRKFPRQADWPEPKTVKSLTPMLMVWSYKEVRTEFDRLVREKLIEADRPSTNGPWVYTLPQDIEAGRSAFRKLPKPAAIRAKLAASLQARESNTACPACPSLAQTAGQPEVQQQLPLTPQNGPIAPFFEELGDSHE